MIKYLSILTFVLVHITTLHAQNQKISYDPCFLKDSVEKHLSFIKQNTARIFTASADCKDILLDSIAARYTTTKDIKYLYLLSAIDQNPAAKVEGLYTDIVTRFAQNDFEGFVEELYRAQGKLIPLQNELIAAMNIIIDGRPFKQKYMGHLNVEIDRSKDSNDKSRQAYLEKLKQKIDEEKYR